MIDRETLQAISDMMEEKLEEKCYADTYERYQKGGDDFEARASTMMVMEKIVLAKCGISNSQPQNTSAEYHKIPY